MSGRSVIELDPAELDELVSNVSGMALGIAAAVCHRDARALVTLCSSERHEQRAINCIRLYVLGAMVAREWPSSQAFAKVVDQLVALARES